MRHLAPLRGNSIHQHFHHAYSPWANGTVEVANRDILRVLRPLLMELQVRPADWHTLVPLLQSALNHAPRERLSGRAPIQLFTSLPTTRPIETILREGMPVLSISWQDFEIKNAAAIQAACNAVDTIHKEIAEKKEKGRASSRKSAARNATSVNFDKGDFVLVAVPTRRSKLEANWLGPRKIVEVVNENIYKVKDVVTGIEKEVHSSRLRLFSEKLLNVSVDLKKFIEFNTVYEV